MSTGLVNVGGTAADLQARGVATGAAGAESAMQGLARAAKLGQREGPVPALSTSPLTGVELLRQRVVGALAPLVDSMFATFASQTRQPPSVEAYRELLAFEANFYSDEPAAMDHYRRTAQMDSSYLFPLLRFVLVASNRGDTPRYDSAVAVLRPRRERMTLFEQAYFDNAVCITAVDQEPCVTATKEMLRLSPKSQNVAYLYGVSLRRVNRPHADSVLRRLDPTSGELAGRVFLIEHASAAAVDWFTC